MALKRPAASTAGGAAKKAAIKPAAVIKAKVNEVIGAIKEAEHVPASCRTMLVHMAGDSLNVFASERHEFQTAAVDMIEGALEGLKASKENSISETETKISNGAAEKEKRAKALEDAEAKAKQLSDEVAAKKAALEEAVEAETKGEEELQGAKDAVSAFDEELAQAETSLGELKESLKELEEGPLAAFATLKALSAPPPPAPEPEAAAEATEAPTATEGA
mmetsp:Transcript_5105/g.12231  ORF Transcript_5105/g.12231 Transcript_5105/m.12231 type:complete len:220 (+) Transcript_5105:79-738(+)